MLPLGIMEHVKVDRLGAWWWLQQRAADDVLTDWNADARE